MPFDEHNPLILKYWNGTCWITDADLKYKSNQVKGDLGYDYVEVLVPKGFATDLASVPQIFWNLFPPQGGTGASYAPAAVVHDYLYQKGKTKTYNSDGNLENMEITRYTADCVLYQAMIDLHVSKTVAYMIYLGVRIGGLFVWNKYRRQS